MSRGDFWAGFMEAVADFGQPLYGLDGSDATGTMQGHSGKPTTWVILGFRTPEGQIEVTTSRRPMGGTGNLLNSLLAAEVREKKITFPWSMTIEERLVMLRVGRGRSQFRVLKSSHGMWAAAGGFEKRHITMTGTKGTVIDDLALVPTVLDFGSWLGPLPSAPHGGS